MFARRFEFIAPTRELRELRILGEIAEGGAGSLRALAIRSLLGRTMVHKYIGEMESHGWIRVQGRSNRDYQYQITERGFDRLDELLLRASREVVQLYGLMKAEFRRRLRGHAQAGVRRVVLFGAAETAELVCAAAEGTGIEVVGVVDSDPSRQGRCLGALRVEPPRCVLAHEPDAVIITSHGHVGEMVEQMRHVESQGVQVIRI